MNRIFGLTAIFAAVLLAADADATGCRTRVVAQSYHAPVYDYPVAIATFLPIAVPAYSIGYAPQGDSDAALKQEIATLRLELQIRDLRDQIRGLTNRPQIPQNLEPPQKFKEPAIVPKKVGASAQHCAKCHDSISAVTTGGGYSFFTNGVLTATPEQRLAMIAAAHSNTMPKTGPKLTDEQYADVVYDLTGIAPIAKKPKGDL